MDVFGGKTRIIGNDAILEFWNTRESNGFLPALGWFSKEHKKMIVVERCNVTN